MKNLVKKYLKDEYLREWLKEYDDNNTVISSYYSRFSFEVPYLIFFDKSRVSGLKDYINAVYKELDEYYNMVYEGKIDPEKKYEKPSKAVNSKKKNYKRSYKKSKKAKKYKRTAKKK